MRARPARFGSERFGRERLGREQFGHDAGDGAITCHACGRPAAERDLDHRGECEECREALQRKVRRAGRLAGALVAVAFAAWILLEGTSGVLPAWAWLLPLAVAWYLGMRLGSELVKGIYRARSAGRRHLDPDPPRER